MFSYLYKETARDKVTPALLSDKITQAGRDKKICLVSDSRARFSPTAHEMALWLAQDKWDVTLLDLTPFEGMATEPFGESATQKKAQSHGYHYLLLRGLFQQKNHAMPTVSLAAYHWLRDKDFDLILFQHDFGAGYFSCVARDLGLAFEDTPLLVMADDPYAYWLEQEEVFPEDLFADYTRHYFEQQTVARADGVLLSDKAVAPWLGQTGWIKAKDQKRVAVIGENEGQPWGQWIAGYAKTAQRVPPIAESDILISVCIAVYNRAEMLRRTLQSLSEQSDRNFEVIVVDDGSTLEAVDSLRREMAGLFAERGWQWARQENQGPGEARNHGARLSRGSHLFFLDDDNIPLPDMIALLRRAAGSGADVICTNHGLHPLSENAHYVQARFPVRPACGTAFKDIPMFTWFFGASLLTQGHINTVGDTHSLFRRDVFQKLGGFTSDQKEFYEDIELLIRAITTGYRLETMPELILLYRFHHEGRSRAKIGLFRSNLQLLRLYAPLMPEDLHPLLLINRVPLVNKHRPKPGRFPDTALNPSYGRDTQHRRFRDSAASRRADQPKIALVARDHSLHFTCVTLASLLSTSSTTPEIYVITDMTAENQERLALIAHRLGGALTFVQAPAKGDPSLPPSFKLGNEPNALYWQLLLPELLPHLDRVLVIDHDKLIRHDLGALWQMDMGDRLLAAVPHHFLIGNQSVAARFGNTYFDCSVMLVNLALWRQHTISTLALQTVAAFEADHDVMQFWGQSALNKVIGTRWLSLSPTWNCLDEPAPPFISDHYREFPPDYQNIAQNPAIAFFSYANRPWVSDYGAKSPLAHEYRVYMRQIERLTSL